MRWESIKEIIKREKKIGESGRLQMFATESLSEGGKYLEDIFEFELKYEMRVTTGFVTFKLFHYLIMWFDCFVC
jgi:hypothetical protein